jgi:lipoprotein-anchoring transpeptidase ErfK/SrfK
MPDSKKNKKTASKIIPKQHEDNSTQKGENSDNQNSNDQDAPSDNSQAPQRQNDQSVSETFKEICFSTAKTYLIFIGIATLTFFYADFQLYTDNYQQLSRDFDHYYYRDWEIEKLKKEFELEHKKPFIVSYAKKAITGKDLANYQKKLNRKLDHQAESIREITSQKARVSSIFYITEIRQDTQKLEDHFQDLETAIDQENQFLINWEIGNIENEIIELSQIQDKQITTKIDEKQEKLQDLEFLASYYGLDFQDSIQESENIENSDDQPVQKFTQIDSLIQEEKKELTSAILKRGGQESPDSKRIVIDIGQQHLYMIENDNVIYDMPAATGIPKKPTVAGEFQVYDKIDMAWGYYEIWMPYWMTIYYAGSSANGIHGIPLSPSGVRWSSWEKRVGVYPTTYGCVMPLDKDVKKLYNWANIGTPVSIFY